MEHEEHQQKRKEMASDSKQHVVMFPWLAFGHMIPYLELSKFIAQKGHVVSFVSTPRNIDRLPKLPPDLAPLINLVKLPLPRLDGLPENAEATMDVRSDYILKKAFDGLQTDLTRFLETSVPDWIIYDFAPHWLPPIAARLNISSAMFIIINAWFLCFLGPPSVIIHGSDPRTEPEHFTVPPSWVPFPTKVSYRPHEINWIIGAAKQNVSGISDAYRLGLVSVGSDVIMVRHCEECEPEWLDLLQELYRKPVIPVGLMPPTVQDGVDDKTAITEWLDQQNTGAVVYVALGSEVRLSQQDLTELALGLELSQLPFLWVLRKPPGSNESDSVDLPEGFVERTKEGLMLGRPLIMLPFLVDQGLNARVFEGKKVGIEIPRDEGDGSFTRNSVAESVRLVMVEEEGKTYRDNAKEMKAVFGDKDRQDRYIESFIEYLENHRRLKKD
ncbi:hypothetical protein F0562_003076 [Nyssa sinensis]|uniref:Uncharacterized protein n=1 Tax=Nyssa sinensis TaxID=561372 RepID=A0A5J5BU93_9ASTE|nr:hypothetical protein F0562_003076 [Nyssa sinensis]